MTNLKFTKSEHTIDVLILPFSKLTTSNPYPIHLVVDWKHWPERNRVFRNWHLAERICARIVTDKEEQHNLDHQFRMNFYKYLNWDGLLKDELNFVKEDSNYYQRLLEVSKMRKYNYIPFYTVGKQIALF